MSQLDQQQAATRDLAACVAAAVRCVIHRDFQCDGHALVQAVDALAKHARAVSRAAPDQPVLSVRELSTLRAALELIVLVVLAPRLTPGVGVDVAARLRSKTLAQHAAKLPLPRCRDDAALLAATRLLVDLAADQSDQIGSIVATHFLSDVLAALLCLQHAPDVPLSVVADAYALSAALDTAPIAAVSSLAALLPLLRQRSSQSVPWLRPAVVARLSRVLEQPGGVLALMQLLLGDEPDSRSLQQAVLVLTSCPADRSRAYLAAVCPQLLHLMQHRPSSRSGRQLVAAAAAVSAAMLRRHKDTATDLLLRPLLRPLLLFQKQDQVLATTPVPAASSAAPARHPGIQVVGGDGDDAGGNDDDGVGSAIDEESVVVSEQDLSQCIELLHCLVFDTGPDATHVLLAMSCVAPVLLRLYCFIANGVASVRIACKELLVAWLKVDPTAASLLRRFLVPTSMQQLDALAFAPGSTGGVRVRRVNHVHRDIQAETRVVLDLLAELKSSSLSGDLFCELLREFMALRTDTEDQDRSLHLLHTLIDAAERLGAAVLSNVAQVAVFLRALLLMQDDDETLDLALGLLAMLTSGAFQLKPADLPHLEALIPVLEPLCESEAPHIREMALSARTALFTRTPDWGSEDDSASDMASGDGDAGGIQAVSLHQTLEDLRDPMLPVRGHALVQLRRLLRARRVDVLAKSHQVYQLLMMQLADPDSYVFLAAVHALAELADARPDQMIPRLAQAYRGSADAAAAAAAAAHRDASRDAFTRSSDDTSDDEAADAPLLAEQVRMKLGEALVAVARRRGAVMPQHASLMMPAFLETVRDPLPGLRASALSNLAEMLVILRHAASPFLRRTIDCVTGTLRHDTETAPRRSAVFLAHHLLDQLGAHVLSIMPSELSALRAALVPVADTDGDAVVRAQARGALALLHDMAKTLVAGAVR